MNTINDGGAAFPSKANNTDKFEGMTLRDYFAAAALQGILRADEGSDGEPAWGFRNNAVYAEQAFKLADALLAARQTKETKE